MTERWNSITRTALRVTAATSVGVSLTGAAQAGKATLELRPINEKLGFYTTANEKLGGSTWQLVSRPEKSRVFLEVFYAEGLAEQDPEGAMDSLTSAGAALNSAGEDQEAAAIIVIVRKIASLPRPSTDHYQDQRRQITDIGESIVPKILTNEQERADKKALISRGWKIAAAPPLVGGVALGILGFFKSLKRRGEVNTEEADNVESEKANTKPRKKRRGPFKLFNDFTEPQNWPSRKNSTDQEANPASANKS